MYIATVWGEVNGSCQIKSQIGIIIKRELLLFCTWAGTCKKNFVLRTKYRLKLKPFGANKVRIEVVSQRY